MNLPNLLSLARLLSVPVLVWLIMVGQMQAAFWLFVAASATDAIDGFIARRFGSRTVVGAYLDPLADKALLTAVYISLGHEGWISLWLVILVVFRDIVIVGGVLLYQLLAQSIELQPMRISKINTAAQISLVTVVLASLGLSLPDVGLVPILEPVTAATTVVSGVWYLVDWTRRAADLEEG
ncbi:MAG: CDP-alcohol phosphatidyltransferase family protein [Alphaproteobacteria bacterium]|nr:CDP-alcohol phosphatidyltransferase family protein [Alphaproteobacteria bacterium]